MDINFTVKPRGEGKAFLVVDCAHTSMGKCMFPLWRRPAEGATWEWDGDVERPTIRPSIDCKGGCDRHFVMTAGKVS